MKEYITREKVYELLGAPSGTRPRIYGWWLPDDSSDTILAIRSRENLEYYETHGYFTEFWISHATVKDIIKPA